MSTIVSQTLSNGTVSTSTANVIRGSARAWVNFNGTGTVAIRTSYNVSSITDNGTGDYTINFTNALDDANYSIVGSINPLYAANNSNFNINSTGTASGVTESAPTTSSFRIITTSPGPTALDPKYVNIAVFD
jgi:hypothetical protein